MDASLLNYASKEAACRINQQHTCRSVKRRLGTVRTLVFYAWIQGRIFAAAVRCDPGRPTAAPMHLLTNDVSPFKVLSARHQTVVAELRPRRVYSHGVLHCQEKLGAPGVVVVAATVVVI